MTKDESFSPQEGPLADFFAEARATFLRSPDPTVERQHLAAMVEAFTEAPDIQRIAPGRRSFMNRVLATRAAKAFGIGLAALLATGSALAATESLPDKVQDALADTVDVVLDIPGGSDEQQEADENDDGETADDADSGEPAEHGTARSTEGCGDGFSGNHGEFVSGTEATPRNEAAQSDCGKPEGAVHEDEDADGVEDEGTTSDDGANRPEGSDTRGQSAEHANPRSDDGRPEGNQGGGQGQNG